MRKRTFWLTAFVIALMLSIGTALAQQLTQPGVTLLINRDGVNVRLLPALGAEVLGFVNAGWTASVTGRSPDNEWVRIDFNGEEAWIGTAVINLFGDINSLPVADPRTIPYGGFESPRAGLTSVTTDITGKLADSGLRVRAGPSRAYPVLANAPRNSIVSLLGRSANNAWLQVSFEGTLGWIATGYVEIQNGRNVFELPIDGIVAESLPLSEPTADDYLGTLRFMLDRLNLAQPSLDEIRARWTNIALTGVRSGCGFYPARPTDYNIPNPLLAAYFPVLDPIQADFNAAMANVRLAVDLLIQVCGFPGPDVVGQGAVSGALNIINTADAQFTDLRQRITDLIPLETEVGSNDCLFTFQEQSDILPLIVIGTVSRDTFSPGKTAAGYCFDVGTGISLRVEVLTLRGNVVPILSVSALANPTNFIAAGRGFLGQSLVTVSPITITTGGRYLLVVNTDPTGTQGAPLEGEIAILITDITNNPPTGPGLSVDGSGNLVIATAVPPVNIGTSTPPPVAVACPVVPPSSATCTLLASCDQVRACYLAGGTQLDPDLDRAPCEEAPLNCPVIP